MIAAAASALAILIELTSSLLSYGGGWFVLFAVAAALPMLFSATGRKSVVSAFVAFGIGGGVSGGLIAILLITHNLGGSPGAVALAFAIPFTLPWIIGAVIVYFRRPDAPRGPPNGETKQTTPV